MFLRFTFLGLSTLEKFKITLEQIIPTVKGLNNYAKGAFNNYVDKMRGGGQKMSVFVNQNLKTLQILGLWPRICKTLSRLTFLCISTLEKFKITL